MLARALAVAWTLTALAGAQVESRAVEVAAARPAFSRDEWVELVRGYAGGERAQAVARLGAWSLRDLGRQIAAVEQAARAAERCPHCPNPLDDVPLRAAVMLHWDRDRTEQPSPLPGEVEQPRRCPGPVAGLAGRLARVVAGNAEASDFARRFFRLVVLQCQWDACFADAQLWASNAVEIFPRDADLLLARGSVREEVATIGSPCATPAALAVVSGADKADAIARQQVLEKARRDFTDALAVDGGLGLARVRLGRVLWRLGEPEPARQQLEKALATASLVDHVYLAHLFLGRVYQDAGRLEDATREYALAADLHPTALSAATALSHARLLAGDAEGARQA
ncbi:MAG TPA: hypothetical protein VFQ51_08740, partial [Vicinamibacteria bacterium]|nr:hypothetical protein [Vicinamibacteria bacterium]